MTTRLRVNGVDTRAFIVQSSVKKSKWSRDKRSITFFSIFSFFFFLVFINGFSESLSNFTNWFQHCFLTRFSNVIFNTLFITFNCVSIFIAGDRFLLNIWQFFGPNIIPLVQFHLNILYFIRYIYRNIPLKMEKFKKQVIKKK